MLINQINRNQKTKWWQKGGIGANRVDGDVSKMGNPVTLIPDYEKTPAIEFFSQKKPVYFPESNRDS